MRTAVLIAVNTEWDAWSRFHDHAVESPRRRVMADDLERASMALFERHRVDAFGGSFHVPDVARYPALFAWDSGYHALSTVHLRPDWALGELSTLYTANTLADGLLSHQRYVPGAEDHQGIIEGLFGSMFDGDRTPLIDPPTAAYAAAHLSLLLGTPADPLLDAALAHLDALAMRRTVEGCSLPVVLHPFETGTEGSAIMAPLVPSDLAKALPRLRDLTQSAMATRLQPEVALRSGHGFVVYDPTVCGWYLLALEELAEACSRRGRETAATALAATAGCVAEDVCKWLWWPAEAIFAGFDLAGHRRLDGIGAMGLIPAAAATLIEAGYSAQVADRNIRPGTGMWGPHGFAAGVVKADAGVRDFVEWSGNAVWGATTYWAHLVTARLGRVDLAAGLRSQLEELISAHGFREFYDAWTGQPGGAGAEAGFTWPALVLEMRAREGNA
jgi:hypothetical protein